MATSVSKEAPTFSVSLSLEAIKLPPVQDILVLAKRLPQGKVGVLESFRFIAPDEFEMYDVDEESEVEAVLINKRILKRMPLERVLDVLRAYVFPHVSAGEAVKVDFTVRIDYTKITGDNP